MTSPDQPTTTGQEQPARLTKLRYAEIKRWSRDECYRREKGLKGHALLAIQQLVAEIDRLQSDFQAAEARADRYRAAIKAYAHVCEEAAG